MSSRRDMRKRVLVVVLLGLALGACSSAPAGASPSAAPTGAPLSSSAGSQPPAATAQATQPATAAPTAAPSLASIKDMDICALISEKEIETTVGFDVEAGKKLQEQTERLVANGTRPLRTRSSS